MFAVLGSIIIAPQDRSTTKAARIDELISRYQQGGYFNGSILVAEHGKVIYEKGVGYANMRMHTPNTPQTKFGIASISKQFTAALVLMQVTNGNLRLDATVSEILPWYRKDTGSRITIEQLCDTLLAYLRIMTPRNSATEWPPPGTPSRKRLPKAYVSGHSCRNRAHDGITATAVTFFWESSSSRLPQRRSMKFCSRNFSDR